MERPCRDPVDSSRAFDDTIKADPKGGFKRKKLGKAFQKIMNYQSTRALLSRRHRHNEATPIQYHELKAWTGWCADRG
ncbi:hypothetical protein GCM10008094_19080 [Aidingimonas halophila]|nr:hypothetical protein GCM10008094_19080 [Aidingimonas halophila]